LISISVVVILFLYRRPHLLVWASLPQDSVNTAVLSVEGVLEGRWRTHLTVLLLICMSWTITGQLRNSVFIRGV